MSAGAGRDMREGMDLYMRSGDGLWSMDLDRKKRSSDAERSLGKVRGMASFGDCTGLGGLNLGTIPVTTAEGTGVGRGGKNGLLGAVMDSEGSSVSDGISLGETGSKDMLCVDP